MIIKFIIKARSKVGSVRGTVRAKKPLKGWEKEPKVKTSEP